MSVTKSHLLDVYTHDVRVVGQYFGIVSSDYGTAESRFETDVANKIKSGHAWRGEGVPNATMVADANTSALAASKVVTEACWYVLDGFAAALYNAQQKLRGTLNEAASNHITVAEDGTATVDLPTPVPGCGPPPAGQTPTHFDPNQEPELAETYRTSVQMRDRIEREAKGYLAFATIADNSCSGMLEKLWRLSPTTTDKADPKTLAYNHHVLAGALYARNLARLTRDFWDTAKPTPVPEDHDGWSIEKIAVDVVGIAGNTAGLLTSFAADTTGVAVAFGFAKGAAALGGIYTNVKNLVNDTKGTDDSDDSDKPEPPKTGDELLEDAYETGKVPEKDLDEGGDVYRVPPGTTGIPPADKDDNPIPYKQFDVGRPGEVLVVDDGGHMYYSDDNGKSFVEVA